MQLLRVTNDRGSSVTTTASDFDEFYRREFVGLVVLAVGVIGQRHGAEDLVQEAMIDAHRRWDRVGAYDSPRGWVRRVVVQRGMKSSRRRHGERTAALRSDWVSRDLTLQEVGGLDPALREALASLSAKQRAVLALHYLEDMDVAATAEVLGITEGTVKTHLSRGRLRLRDLMDGRRDTERSEQDV